MNIETNLIKADNICDYIPIVSTVSNLADLFQKCVLYVVKTETKNRYWRHIQNKDLMRCLYLLVPGFGNIAALIFDLNSSSKAKGDIREIRMLLKGNVDLGHKLFREAVEQNDAISQIQLSHALFGIKWGKDFEKDFSTLTSKDLEEYSYYPRDFALFNSTYDSAMGTDSDYTTANERGFKTFHLASNSGYLPATLELLNKEWRIHLSSFGYAAALRPYVGKGDKMVDFSFGQALKSGTQAGTKSYYEGMYWMEQSRGITVKYPDRDFESFKKDYVRYTDSCSTYYDYDGFRHVGSSVILAPNEHAWKTFVDEKLKKVEIAPLESYQIKHDPKQLAFLMKENKIEFVVCSTFVSHPTKGREIADIFGKPDHGFRINTLSVYAEHKKIGEISVQEDTFEIYQTIKDPKLQIVIDFIESVMKRTGSAYSAYSWLRQINESAF